MLAVVPARGGSVGVPRKNLRNLAGKPLILHLLDTLARVPEITRTVVSTDDPDIASFCCTRGHDVIDRPAHLAEPDVPVAQVAVHAVEHENWYGPVGVFQPTSPTLQAETVSDAIKTFNSSGDASLCSVVGDAHLLWDACGPLHSARANRQHLEPFWRETGGIQLARAVPVGDLDPLVGHPHQLYPLPADQAVDIDTPDDLAWAERILNRQRVHFVLTAGDVTGSGHVHRCLALADELFGHECTFSFAPEGTTWAWALVQSRGYNLGEPDLSSADLIVFDRLDTPMEAVAKIKAQGLPVVCLEDLGPGSDAADLVVNELYADMRPYVLSGPRYAVLRPEFLCGPQFKLREKADRVLVTFGGTDPSRLNDRVSIISRREAKVRVLEQGEPVAEAMLSADLVLTSAGRTVHEAAALGVPCISIAANERESRHSHCAGVLRLGLHAVLSNDQIQEAVHRVLKDTGLRSEMSETSRAQVDGLGARRIVHRMNGLLEGL